MTMPKFDLFQAKHHWSRSGYARTLKVVISDLQVSNTLLLGLEGNRDCRRAETWPSWICWSNLLKVGPSSMQTQPPAMLKKVQLSHGIRLITQELAEFNPRRVLVLAGRNWFNPF